MAEEGPIEGAEEVPSSDTKTSTAIDKAFKAVPEAGEAGRWYSPIYRAIRWLQTSWRRKLLPPPAKRALSFILHWIIDINEYERLKVWDRTDSFHNLFVPSDEHVTMPSVTVVELFPPSHIDTLRKSIERNGWTQRMSFASDRDNVSILEDTRSMGGWSGWDLANIAPPGSGYFAPEIKKQRIPDQFSFIAIKAEPLGPSVTAVLTTFTLSPEWRVKLDEEWHSDHQPSFRPLKTTRPRTSDRQWAAFERTQTVRRGLHDLARQWVSDHLPGYFTTQRETLPSSDVLLFENYDPAADEDHGRDFGDALRALGFTNPVTRSSSPSFPGLVFTEVEESLCRPMGQRISGFVGNSAIVAAAQEHLNFYGSDRNQAIARMAAKYNSSLLLKVAIDDYLRSMIRRYATLRDRAQEHRKFSARYIRELRENFLAMSFDLALASKAWRNTGTGKRSRGSTAKLLGNTTIARQFFGETRRRAASYESQMIFIKS
jgi:hypothetical protein